MLVLSFSVQALGTQSGCVHLLDHAGVLKRTLRAHRMRVNDISIELSGDHIASCSDDGTVVVTPVNSPESATFNYHRPVACVRLEPNYSRTKERPFVSGESDVCAFVCWVICITFT
jgi:hypothetical protein